MAMLCYARLLVECVPLERWRRSLGLVVGTSDSQATDARRLAAHVQHAANHLPFDTKCLPRAMALSWLLRRATVVHAVVIAVRPPDSRDAADGLHAWVEVAGEKILGDLPGPWIETLRLGA